MSADRRLRLALRAFPRRFRAARRDEIDATIADARADGDDHIDSWPGLVDIVRAGWAERWRTRPPLGRYLRYRFLDQRLEPRWHPWMLDDLRGWFPARSAVATYGLMLAMFTVVQPVLDLLMAAPVLDSFWHSWFVWMAIGQALGAGIEAVWHVAQSRILRRHGYDPATFEPIVASQIVVGLPDRVIRRAAPILAGTALGLLVVAPVAAVAVFDPDLTIEIDTPVLTVTREADHQVLAGALALGLAMVLAVVAARWSGRLERRYITTSPVFLPGQRVVHRPGHESGRGAFGLVVVPGIAMSLLPIGPLAVPLLYLVAVGAAPALLVVATRLRRFERRTGERAWLRRPATDRHLVHLGGRPLR